MSFLEVTTDGLDPEGTALLDVEDSVKSGGADWTHQGLLDTSGAASDFDISSLLHQLTGAGKMDVAGGQMLPLEQMAEQTPDGDTSAVDVSLSALLGDAETELQAALMVPPQIQDLALKHPSVPPPSPVTLPSPMTSPTKSRTRLPTARPKKTFIVVKKTPKVRVVGRPPREKPPYGDPPPAPLSAYSIFYKEQYQRLKSGGWKSVSVNRANKHIAKMWRQMRRDDRQPYAEAAEREKEQYRDRLAQYRRNVRLWKNQNNPKRLQHVDGALLVMEPLRISSDEETTLDDDPADLYCALCSLYCSNAYNKKEHLEGNLHLRRMRMREEQKAKEQIEAAAAAYVSHGEGNADVHDQHVETARNHDPDDGDNQLIQAGEEPHTGAAIDQHIEMADDQLTNTVNNQPAAIVVVVDEQSGSVGEHQTGTFGAVALPSNIEIGENEVDVDASHNGDIEVVMATNDDCDASPTDIDISATTETPADVDDAMEALMSAVLRQSRECRFLASNREQLSAAQLQLSERLRQLEARRDAASAQLEAARQQGHALAGQLESLMLLPTKFGVRQRWSAEPTKS